MRFSLSLIVMLSLCSSALAADQSDSPGLVDRVEKMGLRTFNCEITGRQVLDPTAGFDGLSDLRALRTRQVLASNGAQATKHCLNQVAATKGSGPGRTKGTNKIYFMIRNLPELKGSGFNLFLVDDLKVSIPRELE